jgi:hypothetical protein
LINIEATLDVSVEDLEILLIFVEIKGTLVANVFKEIIEGIGFIVVVIADDSGSLVNVILKKVLSFGGKDIA